MTDDDKKEKTQKFSAKVRRNLLSQGVQPQTERATSYQKLRERLHRNIEEVSQKPNIKYEEEREKAEAEVEAATLKEEKVALLLDLMGKTATLGGCQQDAKGPSGEYEAPESRMFPRKVWG